MYGRWFNFAVVVLWLVTMTWLVKAKVLPTLLIGDPPDHRKILEARQNEPPVGWQLRWNDRSVGWAMSATRALPEGDTRIVSRVHFDELPLGEMTPGWLRAFSRLLEKPSAKLETDARSVLTTDTQGRLARIESSIDFQPLREVISVTGVVEGSEMTVTVRSRDFSYKTDIAIDPKTLEGDSLSPRTQLPGLHEGQTWTVEVCSPLRYPNRPLEILQAKVERLEQLHWNGRAVRVWLVEYHDNPGYRLSSAKKPRGRLWVQLDGTVLKQEKAMFNSTMTFIRMLPDEAAALAEEQDVGPAVPAESRGVVGR